MLTPLYYSLVTALATYIGGLLPLYSWLRHIQMRYVLAIASGVMLSVAFFEMLPEMGPAEINFVALGVGFFSIYIIEKLVLIHSCGESECETHTIGLVSLIGIAVESLVDGMAIAAGFSLAPAIGIPIALAVMVHEIPRGFTTSVIMKTSGYKNRTIVLGLSVDALFCPLGAALVVFWLRTVPTNLFQLLLAFAAGTFIYIGASDLLPEAHKRFNIKVVMMVVAGVLLIPGMELLLRV